MLNYHKYPQRRKRVYIALGIGTNPLSAHGLPKFSLNRWERAALSNRTTPDLRDICVNSLSRDYSDNETNEKQRRNDDIFHPRTGYVLSEINDLCRTSYSTFMKSRFNKKLVDELENNCFCPSKNCHFLQSFEVIFFPFFWMFNIINKIVRILLCYWSLN